MGYPPSSRTGHETSLFLSYNLTPEERLSGPPPAHLLRSLPGLKWLLVIENLIAGYGKAALTSGLHAHQRNVYLAVSNFPQGMLIDDLAMLYLVNCLHQK